MKTKFSKRVISLFLAVLMVVTSIPMFAISASADSTDETATVSTGYFNHANAHDPTIVDAYEGTTSDGKVYHFPMDYVEKNTMGYTSWDQVISAYGITSYRKVYFVFGTHFDNEKSYDLKNWTVVSDLGSITMFGSIVGGSFSTDVSGTPLQYGSTGVSSATLRSNYPEFDYMCSYAKYSDGDGDVWAADMVFNYTLNRWSYYASCSAGQQTETIFFATSQRLDGNFIFGKDANDHTDCFVLVGGFSKSDWAKHPFLEGSSSADVFKTGSNFAKVYKTVINSNSGDEWDNTSTTKYPGYIDPAVFYDKNGNLWMAYGSHANGIWIVPLEEDTGSTDFATMKANGNSYKNNNNTGTTAYDIYSGVKIVNSDSSSNGEGAYIVYDTSQDVYILTISYGNLGENDGYTMRVFTSTSPDGPYYDAAGTLGTSDASPQTNSKNGYTVGAKQMGNYKFGCIDFTYASPGHNSMFFTDTNGDGTEELFNVYHSRYFNMNYYNDGNGGGTSSGPATADPSSGNAYWFNDFIHRAYVVPSAESGSNDSYGTNPHVTTVTMPFEYSGEQMESLDMSVIAGKYNVVDHGNATSTNSVTDSLSMIINTDGSVTGDFGGTVEKITAGTAVNGRTYPYDVYKLNISSGSGSSTTFYGVFMKQYNESSVFKAQQGAADITKQVVVFSIMGVNNNAIWGTKTFFETGSDLTAVDAALSEYETEYKNTVAKMKNDGKIYTNLKPAYDAYIKLCKARDAYVYGEDTAVKGQFESLITSLNNEIATMTSSTWSSPTGNAVPAFNAGTVPSAAYSNLLYSNKVDANVNFECSVNYSSSDVYSAITNNQTVMLVDGVNTSKMPVLYRTILRSTSGTKNRAPYMVYPTTSSSATDDLGDLYLQDKWRGYVKNGTIDNSSLFNFETIYGKTDNYIGHNSSTMNAGYEMSARKGTFSSEGWSNYFAYANVLAFSNSVDFGSSYSKKYNLNWIFRSEDKGKTVATDLKNSYGTANDNAAIYVVNYKALLDAVTTAIGNLPAAVDSYKQGGLSTFLGYIDNATAYDPNTARDGASNAAGVVSNFTTAVSGYVTNLGKISEITLEKTVDNVNYQYLRLEMNNYLTDKTGYLNEATYTAESIADYKKVFDAAKTLFTHLEGNSFGNGYDHGKYAGECYDALTHILNEKFSASSLHSAIQSKPIYDENGKQIYSANSWLAVVGGPINVYNVVKDKTGRYDTETATVHNSSNVAVEYNKKTEDDNQIKSEDAITALSVELDTIPAECQIAFNTSVQIAEAIEKDKYTNSSELTALVAAQKTTVFAVTQATADLYNSFYDTKMADYRKVFATNLSETDAATVKVLNKSNSLTAKTFNTYLQVVDKDGKVVDKDGNVGSKSLASTNNYGDLITVNSGVIDIPVAWTVKLYADDDTNCTGTVKKTITYSGFSGTALQIKTESNAVVTAKPAYDEAPSSGVAVRVYNGYNNLIDVVYADLLANAQTTLASMTTSMPFYTFNGWNELKEVKTGIYEVTPKFDPAKTVDITTIESGATSVKAVKINSTATVSSSTPHYGWAVKNGDKYQIVAYTTGDYKFSALVDETYVPIIENGGSYYVADGATNVQLTPDNVDKFTKPAVEKIDAQSYLNSKLAQKSPFVYFQVIDKKSDSPKVKLYMRTTAGNFVNESNDSFAFGIYLTKDSTETRFLVKVRNEISGQYYCRLTEATAAYLDTAKAFVTYDYTFTDHDGTSYNKITTTDTYAYDNTIPVVEAIA